MSDARAHVLLVDDNEGFRESTTWLLEGEGFGVEAFAAADGVLKRVAAPGLPRAACVVSDIRMPGMSGIELQAELNKRGCKLPLIFITGHGDIPLAVAAMRDGAADFIEKPFQPETLVQSIEGALRNAAARHASGTALDKLTQRERQVLELVVMAKPNKIIADILGISIKTVELHRAHVMSKLGAHNIQELIRIAIACEQESPA